MHVMDSKTLLFVFYVFCRSGCVNTKRMVQPECVYKRGTRKKP